MKLLVQNTYISSQSSDSDGSRLTAGSKSLSNVIVKTSSRCGRTGVEVSELRIPGKKVVLRHKGDSYAGRHGGENLRDERRACVGLTYLEDAVFPVTSKSPSGFKLGDQGMKNENFSWLE